MKKRSLIAALIVLLCGTSLSAKSFDWSQCWCNYGGGIEKGDFIVNVDAGLLYSDFVYTGYDGYWCLPPIMVEVQYAQPIWKLPFTFGGYAAIRGYGFRYTTYENGLLVNKETKYLGLIFGGEVAYHIMLPPKNLDLYAITRIGGGVPFVTPGIFWTPDYFHFGEAIGAYWYFGKNFGLNLEFGYPFSKFGVSFKFWLIIPLDIV